MGLKIIKEEYAAGQWASAVLRYAPDPTCLNWEGLEHFGNSCENCCCESCKRKP